MANREYVYRKELGKGLNQRKDGRYQAKNKETRY